MWLMVASVLMFGGLIFHGPIAPDLGDQMGRIATDPNRWIWVHWIAAAGLSSYAVAGLIVLTSGSHLVRSGWSFSAWAVLSVGALWTTTTAVAEGTVVADAAVSGATEAFEAWWAFSEGKATGFAFMALAVALIAGSETRNPTSVVPRWFAVTGTFLGVVSFTGWALGMWLGVNSGNLVWVVSSSLMTVWTFGFGLVVARSAAGQPETVSPGPEVHLSGRVGVGSPE